MCKPVKTVEVWCTVRFVLQKKHKFLGGIMIMHALKPCEKNVTAGALQAMRVSPSA